MSLGLPAELGLASGGCWDCLGKEQQQVTGITGMSSVIPGRLALLTDRAGVGKEGWWPKILSLHIRITQDLFPLKSSPFLKASQCPLLHAASLDSLY